MAGADITPRLATEADALEAAKILHAFNTEFGDPAPEPSVLAIRLIELMRAGEVILLAGKPAVGVAVLRFRLSLWLPGQECYLAELYVAPDHRRRGLGRALMEEAMRQARAKGADMMDLGTSEGDEAALALYRSLGFTNREGGPDGPTMLYFERDL